MSSKPTLTVIGATGNLGAPVVKHLALMGYPVKAIVRNPEKAEKLFAGLSGVEIYRANLQRVGELRPALAGSTHVYLNLSTNTVDRTLPFYEEREGVANILEAIDPTAIRQILCISGLGAFDNVAPTGDFSFVPNLIRKQGHRLIKDSGIPYTFLHCTSFLDNFVLYRRKGAYSVIGSTQFPIHFTNCYDYSRHLARAIDNPDAMHREFPVQGVQPHRHKEAAETFLAAFDPEAKVNVLPNWMLGALSWFSSDMKFVKHMADYFSQVPEEFLAKDHGTYQVLGVPEMDLAAYAAWLKKEAFYPASAA